MTTITINYLTLADLQGELVPQSIGNSRKSRNLTPNEF